jgi:hypothetical protein
MADSVALDKSITLSLPAGYVVSKKEINASYVAGAHLYSGAGKAGFMAKGSSSSYEVAGITRVFGFEDSISIPRNCSSPLNSRMLMELI